MKLIIWDFDGTLGYRGPSEDAQAKWTGALMTLLAQEAPDLSPDRETIGHYLTFGEPWNYPEIPHPDLTDPDEWWERFYPSAEKALRAAGVEEARVPSMARQFRAVFTDLCHWHLYGDTIQSLMRLTELGWTHVVLSNHVPELREIVSHVGLAPYIDKLYSSAETGYEKPHPRAIEMVLEDYRGADPVWMIGDSEIADVGGAQQAGLPSILVRHPAPELEGLSQAEHHCQDLDGVIAWLSGDHPIKAGKPLPY